MKDKFKKGPHIRGFTLIELFVVLSIIVLLTVIILPNYNAQNQELGLEHSANLLAQSLRKALEKTMSADEYEGIIPPGGYGLYLRKQGESYQIFLFADCDNNQLWSDDDTCNGFPEEIEDVELENGVKIEKLSPRLTPGQKLHIAFEPPDPTIYFNDTDSSLVAEVTLSLISDTTKKKKISVNRAGLISIE